MKRNVWIFGLVLGTILCVNGYYMVDLCYSNPGFEANDILGYTALVAMFSLVFFGVLNYRNKELNGEISFGKAMKTGSLIALLGSTLYVAAWLLYYYLAVPDFMDQYTQHVLIEAERSGKDVAAAAREMESFGEMYKNPLFVVLITYFEVLPIGLVVALISSLVLRRKKSHTANV